MPAFDLCPRLVFGDLVRFPPTDPCSTSVELDARLAAPWAETPGVVVVLAAAEPDVERVWFVVRDWVSMWFQVARVGNSPDGRDEPHRTDEFFYEGVQLLFSEGIRPGATAESLGKLTPAFRKDGSITAGSSSQISDGAAALVVASSSAAERLGLTTIAEIGAYGQVAGPDSSLQLQPSNAITLACKKQEIAVGELDLIEINEAFAAVGDKWGAV